MKTIRSGILALSATLLFSACTSTTDNETATRTMQDQMNAKDQRISQLEDSLRNCSAGTMTTTATPPDTMAMAAKTGTPEKDVNIKKLDNRPVSGKMSATHTGRLNTLDNNNQDGDVGRDVKNVKVIHTHTKATSNYYSGDHSVSPSKTGNNNGIRSIIKKDSMVQNSGLAPSK